MASKDMELTLSTPVELPDLGFLTDQERASILMVVKADEKLKKISLTTLRRSMETLQQKESEQSCSICRSHFSVFRKQAQCAECKRSNVCSKCLHKNNTDVCQICVRKRQYNIASLDYLPVFSKDGFNSRSPYGSELIHRSLKASRSTPTSPTRNFSFTFGSQFLHPLRRSSDCGSSSRARNCTGMQESVSNENLVDTGSIYSEHCGEVEGGVKGKVCFAVWYKSSEECLYIHVVKAKDLAAAKKDGTSSPYVKTYLLPDWSKRTKRKTRFCRNTTNPEFNDTLKYKVPRINLPEHELWLSVWDQDRLGRNQFLGEVRLQLHKLDLTDIKEHWYPLQKKQDGFKGVADYRGIIRIGLKLEPTSLRISVTQAEDLPPMDSRGQTNAFARCLLLPNQNMSGKKKTKTITASLQPFWNEELLYRGITAKELESQRVLEITIWDADIRGDNEFIGGVRLGPDPIVALQRREWMDSSETESEHWEAMLASPGQWVDHWHTLRSSMDSTLSVKQNSVLLAEKLEKKLSSRSPILPVTEANQQESCPPGVKTIPAHLREEGNSSGMWPRRLSSKKRKSNLESIAKAGKKRHYKVSGEILLGVQYTHKALHVRVKEAKGLAAADSNGLSDPYVKTYLLPDTSKASKRKTKIKKRTLNPVYDETFTYAATPEELRTRTLWLTVWDKDTLQRNQFLGELHLPLGHLNLAASEDRWYQLHDSASHGLLPLPAPLL